MSYTVLLIEDNTDCRELFAMMVRYLGCDVLQAHDGELGVQKALSEKPDLIIMDIGMPNMNGIEALACLRESAVTKSTPNCWRHSCGVMVLPPLRSLLGIPTVKAA